MAFHIIRNDITKMNVDAIVNSANPEPTYAYGTDLAIYTAAGPKALLAEREKIGHINPGDAAVTSACNLQAKYIIHTVAPAWEGGEHQEFEILQSCYNNSLSLAKAKGCRSIAFPLIATGIYGFPKDKALQVAMATIQSFLFTTDMDVFLVVFDETAFVLSGRIYDRIQAYIDSNYVASAGASEYKICDIDTNGQSYNRDSTADPLRKKALTELKKQASLNQLAHRKSYENNSTFGDNVLNHVDEQTFQEKFFEYVDRSNLKPSAIYKPIEMSRQQFSKIQSNRLYQPKKNTAILLCLVLKLPLQETEDLLSRAGFALNPSNKQDIIVKACILNGQYDLFIVDAMMQKNHLQTLIDYDA